MKNIAIVYWSGTGNTKIMAESIKEGAGDSAKLFSAEEFKAEMLNDFDAIALGCPSMGAEELESDTFRPLWEELVPNLSGKSVALFGSYGWGDGEWMRDWAERMKNAGAVLLREEGIITNDAPEDDMLEELKAAGQELAQKA